MEQKIPPEASSGIIRIHTVAIPAIDFLYIVLIIDFVDGLLGETQPYKVESALRTGAGAGRHTARFLR